MFCGPETTVHKTYCFPRAVCVNYLISSASARTCNNMSDKCNYTLLLTSTVSENWLPHTDLSCGRLLQQLKGWLTRD